MQRNRRATVISKADARAALMTCRNLDFVADGLDVDSFGVELLHVKVELDAVIMRLVDAATHRVVIQLHHKPAATALSSTQRWRLSVWTARHQSEHVTVDTSHLVGHTQPQPFHLLPDVDAKVAGDAVGVRHSAGTHVDVGRFAAGCCRRR